MPSTVTRRARAFAPGHVTGIFRPVTDARDPRARGSLGAGLVLDAGVTAEAMWYQGGPPTLRLTSDLDRRLPISEDAARRLLARRRGTLEVHLEHELPVGQGFGSSAAGALATSLAVVQVLDDAPSHAVEVAHLADLFGRGGLGGVASVLGGGLEIRRTAGIPPFGQVVRISSASRVTIGVCGTPVHSPAILGERKLLSRLTAAAANLEALLEDPTEDGFWDAAERFTDGVRLAAPKLRSIVGGLRRRGARAAQAMFGQAFFAKLPEGKRRTETYRWLARRDIHGIELSVARRGARAISSGAVSRPRARPARRSDG